MSIDPNDDLDSSAELRLIDAVCDAFERDLAAGQNPSIESYIEKHPEIDPKKLRLDLIRAECHHRKALGENPDLVAYSERYFLETEEIERIKSDLRRTSDPATKASKDSAENDRDGEFELSADDAATGEATIAMLERRGFSDVRRLGRGAYGEVYRAYDPARESEVAIKTPTDKTLASPKARQRFLKEAQIGELLDHPNIVKTLGIESFEGHDLIIQRFIDGQNLERWFDAFRKRDELPEPETVVELLLPVARALAHVHQRGYSHQDLKPENILIDQVGNVFVTDFGLTIHESEQRSWRGSRAGTMPYMSPEQIRWQTHLIDGRSDIWSFGVILYRLLSGRFPFGGPPPKSKSEQDRYCEDLEKEIPEIDPRPIRQELTGLSRQLTSIYDKCLEKSRKDRYENGDDLAEDLLLFLEKRSASVPSAPPKRPIKIVPKGLRSFDAGDSDFFLELLPGPRHSDGVPESIRFLENRLQGADGNEPLDLGIIFGPSGSGKSSLVKAGLIPRLQNNNYETLFIEATAEDTEVRLLKGLRGKLKGPSDPEWMSLVDTFRLVAQRYKANGRKLLVVIDQFEQWLAKNTDFATDQLVETFRQCNGIGIQVLILTREDFWWRLNEFTSAIELTLSERSNYLRVKLFDRDHARRILLAFGEAYGKLTAVDRFQVDQEEFLDKSLDDLADQNEYVPVRLALFAEMMSDRPWTMKELKRIGGAKGVGIAFLESRFGRNAPIEMKPYVEIAPRLLEAMLPPLGSDIKGQMLSVAELGDATKADPKKLANLLQLMEGDLKLLTKVAADQPEGEVSTSDRSEPTRLTMYQLTHDYLVASIRDWLDERSRGSRNGRAKLMLRTQTELWNRLNRSTRYLPTSMEWLGIRLRTNKSEWTPMQAAMMRESAWRAASKALALLGGLAALSLAAWLTYQSFERRRLAKEFELDRDALYALEISEDNRIRGVIADLVTQHRDRIDVTELFQEFDRPDGTGSREKTIDAMLLVQLGQATDRHRDYLMNQMINNSAGEAKLWQVIHRFLESHASDYLTKELQNRLSTTAASSPAEMLRINASAIGLKDEKFLQMLQGQQNLSNDIVAALLQEPVNNMGIWTDGLLKIKASLAPQVMAFLEKNTLTSNRAQNAAAVLRAFDDGLSTSTVQALSARSTEIEEFQAIMDQLQRLDDAPKNVLIADLGRRLQELDPQLDRNEEELQTCIALPIARLALVAWQLGDPTYLEQITAKERRYGFTRGLVIEMLAQEWVSSEHLWPIVNTAKASDPLLAPALLAVQEKFKTKYPTLSAQEKQNVKRRLVDLTSTHPSAEVHSVALLLWRTVNETLTELPQELFDPSTDAAGREWRLCRPSELVMVGVESQTPEGKTHRFEIASTEITLGLYDKLVGLPKGSTSDPVNLPFSHHRLNLGGNPLAFEIARFCNRLSRLDGIPESQWCYQVDEKTQQFELDLTHSGYRLPTLSEWQIACTYAGWDLQFTRSCESESDTNRFEPAFRFQRHAWLSSNAHAMEQLVATRLPNPIGLYDMYGNVEEIVMDINSDQDIVHSSDMRLKIIGLKIINQPQQLRTRKSEDREVRQLNPQLVEFATGFRVVRTTN